uniref:Uncharacterized protein n=1 Tax=Lactuca sativa TaxID=4236 RepID=A0A9R1UPT9_LACSA|nr:hypothetical protein LSAT_V11C800392790 [Lactuca sativa]
MEYSWPTTIELECPTSYTYNNYYYYYYYYVSNHPLGWNTPGPSTIELECQHTTSLIILPGWNTPGPQPSGWNSPLPIHTVTNTTTTITMGPIIPRDGIPHASQPSGWNANILRVQSSYLDGILLAHNHRVGMPIYTSRHVHITCNHIRLYRTNTLGPYHPTGMEYPLLLLNIHNPQLLHTYVSAYGSVRLRGDYLKTMFVAVTKDGNNLSFPIAFGMAAEKKSCNLYLVPDEAKKGKKTLTLRGGGGGGDSASPSGIRVEEDLNGLSESSSMKMRRNSTSGINSSASQMKLGRNSASWMNNSASLLKVVLDSASLFLDSASQVTKPQTLRVDT